MAIRRWFKDRGYTDIAEEDLEKYEAYNIYALDADDETTHVKGWKTVYEANKDKELLKIDTEYFDVNRVTLILYDSNTRLGAGGLDFDYQDGLSGEVLGVSVVVDNNVEVDSKNYKKIFTLDAKTKRGLIEYRYKQDGAVDIIEDGAYVSDRDNLFVDTIVGYLKNRYWQKAKDYIQGGYRHISRMYNYYGDFGEYSWVYLRRIGIASNSETFLFRKGNTEYDKVATSVSQLGSLIINGQGIRIELIREDRFDDKDFTVIEKDRETNNVPLRYSVEVRDGAGRKIETWFGPIPEGKNLTEKFSNFTPNMKFYEFYLFGRKDNGDYYYGKYKIADKSIVTIVIDGREYLYALSNSTQILENGDITYLTQKGVQLQEYDTAARTAIMRPLPYLDEDKTTAYNMLKDLTVAEKDEVKLDGILLSYKEIKSNRGHLKIIIDGYPKIDQKTGYVTEDVEPMWVTFMLEPESTLLFHLGISDRSYTFKYDATKNTTKEIPMPDISKYVPDADHDNANWLIAKVFNLKFIDNMMVYSARDYRKEKQTLILVMNRLDGRLAYSIFKGFAGSEPKLSILKFDAFERPSAVYGYEKKLENDVEVLSHRDEWFTFRDVEEITYGLRNDGLLGWYMVTSKNVEPLAINEKDVIFNGILALRVKEYPEGAQKEIMYMIGKPKTKYIPTWLYKIYVNKGENGIFAFPARAGEKIGLEFKTVEFEQGYHNPTEIYYRLTKDEGHVLPMAEVEPLRINNSVQEPEKDSTPTLLDKVNPGYYVKKHAEPELVGKYGESNGRFIFSIAIVATYAISITAAIALVIYISYRIIKLFSKKMRSDKFSFNSASQEQIKDFLDETLNNEAQSEELAKAIINQLQGDNTASSALSEDDLRKFLKDSGVSVDEINTIISKVDFDAYIVNVNTDHAGFIKWALTQLGVKEETADVLSKNIISQRSKGKVFYNLEELKKELSDKGVNIDIKQLSRYLTVEIFVPHIYNEKKSQDVRAPPQDIEEIRNAIPRSGFSNITQAIEFLDRYFSPSRLIPIKGKKGLPVNIIIKRFLDASDLGLISLKDLNDILEGLRKLEKDTPYYRYPYLYLLEKALELGLGRDIDRYFRDLKIDDIDEQDGDSLSRKYIKRLIRENREKIESWGAKFKKWILEDFKAKLLNDPYLLRKEAGEIHIRQKEKERDFPVESLRLDPKGTDTPYTLRFVFYQKIWALPSDWGMAMHIIDRSTLVRSFFRKALEFINDGKGEEILPFVGLHALFWTVIFADQLDYKLEWYRRTENRKGKMYKFKYINEKGEEVEAEITLQDLFLKQDIDDLYRYLDDPLKQLGINIETELDELKNMVDPLGEESDFMKAFIGEGDRIIMNKNRPEPSSVDSQFKANQYIDKLVAPMKQKVNELLKENERWLSKFKLGFWPFVKNTYEVFFWTAIILISKVLFSIPLKLLSKNSSLYRYWAPKAYQKNSSYQKGLKTKWGKLFFVSIFILGTLYSAFMLTAIYAYSIGYALFLSSLSLKLLFGFTGIAVWLMFLPLYFVSIREIGMAFVAWLRMRVEKTAVLRYVFRGTFGLPTKKIIGFLSDIFFIKDKNSKITGFKRDPATGFTLVEMWNWTIAKYYAESMHIDEESRLTISSDSLEQAQKDIKAIVESDTVKNKIVKQALIRFINRYNSLQPDIDDVDRLLVFSVALTSGGGAKYYGFLEEYATVKYLTVPEFKGMLERLARECASEKNKKILNSLIKAIAGFIDIKQGNVQKWDSKNRTRYMRLIYNFLKRLDANDAIIRGSKLLEADLISRLLGDTQLHHLKQRFLGEYGILVKRLNKIKGNIDDTAITNFIEAIEKIDFAQSIDAQIYRDLVRPENKDKLEELIDIVEKWINLRLPTNYRWMRSWAKIKELYYEMMVHYYEWDRGEKRFREIRRNPQADYGEKETREFQEWDEFYGQKTDEKFQANLYEDLLRDVDEDEFERTDLGDIENLEVKIAKDNKREDEFKFALKHIKETGLHYVYSPSKLRRAKYGQVAQYLYHIKGEVAYGFDEIMELDPQEFFGVLRAIREYNLNPYLSLMLTKITIYVEEHTATGRAQANAENTWDSSVMRAKEGIGALGYYGKGFFRPSVYMNYEGGQDDYVSEDIITAFYHMMYGFQTKHIEYVKLNWRMPPTYLSLMSPMAKWCAGSVEFLLGRAYERYMKSPNIPWNEKLDTHWTAYFYWKKLVVVLATITFIIFGLVVNGWLVPVNPFLSLIYALLWIINGFLFAEAINLSQVFMQWEREVSFIKGFLKTVKMIIINFVLFNKLIVLYITQGLYPGWNYKPKFNPTGKAMDTFPVAVQILKSNFTTWLDYFAAAALVIILFTIPANAVWMGVWSVFIFSLVAWFAGSYMYNMFLKRTTKTKIHWDLRFWQGLKDAMEKVFWKLGTAKYFFIGMTLFTITLFINQLVAMGIFAVALAWFAIMPFLSRFWNNNKVESFRKSLFKIKSSQSLIILALLLFFASPVFAQTSEPGQYQSPYLNQLIEFLVNFPLWLQGLFVSHIIPLIGFAFKNLVITNKWTKKLGLNRINRIPINISSMLKGLSHIDTEEDIFYLSSIVTANMLFWALISEPKALGFIFILSLVALFINLKLYFSINYDLLTDYVLPKISKYEILSGERARLVLEVLKKLKKTLPEKRAYQYFLQALKIKEEGYDFAVLYSPEIGHHGQVESGYTYDGYQYEALYEERWIIDSPEIIEIVKTTPLKSDSDDKVNNDTEDRNNSTNSSPVLDLTNNPTNQPTNYNSSSPIFASSEFTHDYRVKMAQKFYSRKCNVEQKKDFIRTLFDKKNEWPLIEVDLALIETVHRLGEWSVTEDSLRDIKSQKQQYAIRWELIEMKNRLLQRGLDEERATTIFEKLIFSVGLLMGLPYPYPQVNIIQIAGMKPEKLTQTTIDVGQDLSISYYINMDSLFSAFLVGSGIRTNIGIGIDYEDIPMSQLVGVFDDGYTLQFEVSMKGAREGVFWFTGHAQLECNINREELRKHDIEEERLWKWIGDTRLGDGFVYVGYALDDALIERLKERI